MTSTSKNARMKTAGEVVKRILWDDSLPEEEFVVGYVDRFLGIIERNFLEFSWGDFAAADPEDPAIPEHRIEYFKYKARKVWEKSTKLDLVFGSVGRCQGLTILDVIRTEDAKALETAEDLPDGNNQDAESFFEDDIGALKRNQATKYAVILSIHPCEATKEVRNVHRLASQADLHLTLCVFETNQEVTRILKILHDISKRLNEILSGHEVILGELCLLKDTVVAAKTTDHDYRIIDAVNVLKYAFQNEDITVHDLTCLHVTLARLKKANNETTTETIRKQIERHSGFPHRLHGSWLVAKEVGVNKEIWRSSIS